MSEEFDGHNQPLTGAKKHPVTFSGAMEFAQPVPPGFWSVTMYDAVTRYTAPNPINRYSLGSDDDLKKNADGSFPLYFQHAGLGPTRKPTGCRRRRGRSISSCAITHRSRRLRRA